MGQVPFMTVPQTQENNTLYPISGKKSATGKISTASKDIKAEKQLVKEKIQLILQKIDPSER